ncbi:ParB/RepB/Spo0J family partition protein [Rubellimicrobium sp. CFH 75288]|uniref:ParB/RepB/Spo0J family partition protein n=1 Tax=Rubellimicrobium sp. CFH 75288 TaxID=2697034 RepID=UPI00141274BE|nr:ParB/RepB/Spo0J family partition protein [Rubellimicrobium sp. CFH 75288]NAZ37765.1 ParB/RepB/Spo0J family partition protein [Rubellimicrobium sp. CFH 75288]
MADSRSLRRGLGRGLSALMADLGAAAPGAEPEAPAAPAPDRMLPIALIRPNPDQPRRRFDPEALEDLAASIRRKGVIQPLIVRPRGDGFEIVAGERRWRAAQKAGLSELPVLVRDYSDAELLEVAIIENVQRADLNPIDEGAAYRALIDRFGHTQEEVADALGKSRSHIANQMRLLQLPPEVQEMLSDGRLTAGQARPLIGHPRAAELARRIHDRRLSAREAERLARRPETPPRPRRARDPDTVALEAELSASLGLSVRIDHGAAGGRVTIAYRTLEELDDLLARLGR